MSQYHPPQSKVCSRCRRKPANIGHSWCEACFQANLCTSCHLSQANPGHRWCEACFQASKRTVTVPVKCQWCPNPVVPGGPCAGLCASCGSKYVASASGYSQPHYSSSSSSYVPQPAAMDQYLCGLPGCSNAAFVNPHTGKPSVGCTRTHRDRALARGITTPRQ